jgi:hypothetical protein
MIKKILESVVKILFYSFEKQRMSTYHQLLHINVAFDKYNL